MTQHANHQVIQYGRFAKIVIGLMVPGLFIGAYYGLVYLSELDQWDAWNYAGVAGFLALTIFITLGLMEALLVKVILTEEAIEYHDLFRVKKLRWSEIEGYREDKNYLTLFPNDKHLKKIKLSTYMRGIYRIHTYLDPVEKDLDHQEMKQEKEEILSNPVFGATRKERKKNLKKAKKLCKWFNRSAWLYAIWAFFWSEPIDLVFLIGLLFPLVSFIVVFRHKGLIRVNDYDLSKYPSLWTSVLVPPLIMMIEVLGSYEMLSHDRVWILLAFIIPVIALLALWSSHSFKITHWSEWLNILGALGFGFLIAYPSVTFLNGRLDQSTPQSFQSEVVNKYFKRGRRSRTTYYLTLSSWGPLDSEDRVKVSKSYYGLVEEGDSAEVWLHEGAFGIPWYEFEVKIE